MTYLPPKKAGRAALWPLRNCRPGAIRAMWLFGLCLPLAACGSSGMLGRGGTVTPALQAPPPYQGEQIGSGPARVALIVPMT